MLQYTNSFQHLPRGGTLSVLSILHVTVHKLFPTCAAWRYTISTQHPPCDSTQTVSNMHRVAVHYQCSTSSTWQCTNCFQHLPRGGKLSVLTIFQVTVHKRVPTSITVPLPRQYHTRLQFIRLQQASQPFKSSGQLGKIWSVCRQQEIRYTEWRMSKFMYICICNFTCI
jgi:hypothetical protein